MCGQNKDKDTMSFIQPNCTNAPLHILSNDNGFATMGKVIRLLVIEKSNAVSNAVITNTAQECVVVYKLGVKNNLNL